MRKNLLTTKSRSDILCIAGGFEGVTEDSLKLASGKRAGSERARPFRLLWRFAQCGGKAGRVALGLACVSLSCARPRLRIMRVRACPPAFYK